MSIKGLISKGQMKTLKERSHWLINVLNTWLYRKDKDQIPFHYSKTFLYWPLTYYVQWFQKLLGPHPFCARCFYTISLSFRDKNWNLSFSKVYITPAFVQPLSNFNTLFGKLPWEALTQHIVAIAVLHRIWRSSWCQTLCLEFCPKRSHLSHSTWETFCLTVLYLVFGKSKQVLPCLQRTCKDLLE